MATAASTPDAAASSGRRVLAIAASVHVFLLALWLTGGLDGAFYVTSRPGTRADAFNSFYQAGVNLRAGVSPYTDPAQLSPALERAHTQSIFRYLPPVAMVFAGLSRALPPRPLYVIWLVVLEAVLWLCVWLTLRARRFGARRYTAAAMWLAFAPFVVEMHLGQTSTLMAACILWILLDSLGANPLGSGRRARATVPLAWAATMVTKGFTALFAIPFARCGRNGVAACGLGVVALAAGGYFLAHPGDLGRYVAINLGPFIAEVFPGHMGFQAFLRSITDHVTPDRWRIAAVVIGPWSMMAANLPAAVADVVVLTLAVWATMHVRRDQLFRGLALWTAVFFLTYRQVWEYHYLMLVPVVACAYMRSGAPWTLWAWVLMAMPTPFFWMSRFAAPAEASSWWILYHAVKPAAACIIFGALVPARSLERAAAPVFVPAAPPAWVPAEAAARTRTLNGGTPAGHVLSPRR